jgi:hypothetical protein
MEELMGHIAVAAASLCTTSKNTYIRSHFFYQKYRVQSISIENWQRMSCNPTKLVERTVTSSGVCVDCCRIFEIKAQKGHKEPMSGGAKAAANRTSKRVLKGRPSLLALLPSATKSH